MIEKILKNLVQIGKVSSIDGRKVKVYFPDRKVTSDWLTVLQTTPTITIATALEEEYQHTHTVTIQPWIPTIGATVVTLSLPVQGGGGFVLGGL